MPLSLCRKLSDVLSALRMPATLPVPTYAVRVEGEEIQVGWS